MVSNLFHSRNYSSFSLIIYSTLFIFFLYIVIGYFYFASTIGFLSEFKELRSYYKKQWYVVALLPLFNFLVFFIRFAGVINSINTDSAWKTRNLTEEKQAFMDTVKDDVKGISGFYQKIKDWVNAQ